MSPRIFPSSLCPLFLLLAQIPLHAVPALPDEPLSLSAALGEALEHSPSLDAAAAAIDSARGEVLTAQTRPSPELSFSPGLRRLSEAEGSHREFLGEISLSQTFLHPGKRQMQIALAEQNVDLRRLGVQSARLEIEFSVRQAYFEQLAAQNILSVRRQQLEAAETFHLATAKRVESGYASDFEAVRSEGDVVAAKLALRAAEGSLDAARVQLASLLGRELSADLRVSGDLALSDELPPLPDLLALTLRQHPALRVQALLSEIASTRVKQARLARKPDITAGPSLSFSKSEQIVSLSASIPLPNKNTGRGELASASAEQRKVAAETAQLRRELTSAVARAFAQWQSARAQSLLYSPAYLNQLKEAFSRAEQSYAQSTTSLLIYLETKRAYFDALAEQQQTLASALSARLALEASVGVPVSPSAQTPNS